MFEVSGHVDTDVDVKKIFLKRFKFVVHNLPFGIFTNLIPRLGFYIAFFSHFHMSLYRIINGWIYFDMVLQLACAQALTSSWI